jgi:hypothetical protein
MALVMEDISQYGSKIVAQTIALETLWEKLAAWSRASKPKCDFELLYRAGQFQHGSKHACALREGIIPADRNLR